MPQRPKPFWVYLLDALVLAVLAFAFGLIMVVLTGVALAYLTTS